MVSEQTTAKRAHRKKIQVINQLLKLKSRWPRFYFEMNTETGIIGIIPNNQIKKSLPVLLLGAKVEIRAPKKKKNDTGRPWKNRMQNR